MGRTIMQLRIERKRLLKLANKQFQEEKKIRMAQEEKKNNTSKNKKINKKDTFSFYKPTNKKKINDD